MTNSKADGQLIGLQLLPRILFQELLERELHAAYPDSKDARLGSCMINRVYFGTVGSGHRSLDASPAVSAPEVPRTARLWPQLSTVDNPLN